MDDKVEITPDDDTDRKARDADRRHQPEPEGDDRNIIQKRAHRRRRELLINMTDPLADPAETHHKAL